MEEKKKENAKKRQKPSGSAKETVEEVVADSTEETEVDAKEVSEDVSRKPTKGKKNTRRRNNHNHNGNSHNNNNSTAHEAKGGSKGEESGRKERDSLENDRGFKDNNTHTKETDDTHVKETNATGSGEPDENVEENIAQSSSNKALELELEKQKALVEEAGDRYKRLLAEFENARNRNEKESKRMYDVGAKEVLEKLLPVVDNFERALQAIPEEDRERAFEQGVDKIYKQFIHTLDEIGVRPMNAEGTEFDPNLHNAVMHIEDESFGENVVAEELQKGYMYKEEVLRHSMVKVAN